MELQSQQIPTQTSTIQEERPEIQTIIDSELMCKLLKTPPFARTDYEIQSLEQQVKQVKFFTKYLDESEIIRKCCKFLQLEEFKEGETVFSIGSEGTKFYIILDGKIEVNVKQNNSDELKRVKIIEKGESFGEIALIYKRPRLATIKCVKDCIFGVLQQKHFKSTIQHQETIKIALEMQSLFDMPLFSSWQHYRLRDLYLNSVWLSFKKGKDVYDIGDQSDNMYVIQEGEFQVFARFTTKTQLEENSLQVQRESQREKQAQYFKVRTICQGEFFGEEEIVEECPRKYKITCHSFDGKVLMIQKEKVLSNVLSDESSKQYIFTRLKEKTKKVEERIQNMKQSLKKYQSFLFPPDKSEVLNMKTPSKKIPELITSQFEEKLIGFKKVPINEYADKEEGLLRGLSSSTRSKGSAVNCSNDLIDTKMNYFQNSFKLQKCESIINTSNQTQIAQMSFVAEEKCLSSKLIKFPSKFFSQRGESMAKSSLQSSQYQGNFERNERKKSSDLNTSISVIENEDKNAANSKEQILFEPSLNQVPFSSNQEIQKIGLLPRKMVNQKVSLLQNNLSTNILELSDEKLNLNNKNLSEVNNQKPTIEKYKKEVSSAIDTSFMQSKTQRDTLQKIEYEAQTQRKTFRNQQTHSLTQRNYIKLNEEGKLLVPETRFFTSGVITERQDDEFSPYLKQKIINAFSNQKQIGSSNANSKTNVLQLGKFQTHLPIKKRTQNSNHKIFKLRENNEEEDIGELTFTKFQSPKQNQSLTNTFTRHKYIAQDYNPIKQNKNKNKNSTHSTSLQNLYGTSYFFPFSIDKLNEIPLESKNQESSTQNEVYQDNNSYRKTKLSIHKCSNEYFSTDHQSQQPSLQINPAFFNPLPSTKKKIFLSLLKREKINIYVQRQVQLFNMNQEQSGGSKLTSNFQASVAIRKKATDINIQDQMNKERSSFLINLDPQSKQFSYLSPKKERIHGKQSHSISPKRKLFL